MCKSWIAEKWQCPAISFQDLAMPKLRDDIANAAFYLYRIDPKTGEKVGPCGSGFVFARRSKELPGEKHYYGISNWHVTHDVGASIIRINTVDGKSRFIEREPEDWHFVPKGDDLSAIDLTGEQKVGDVVGHYGEEGCATPEFMKHLKIGLGEDVFMTGLFVDQHGGKRNTPAVRFGNLSLLADREALIEQPNGMLRPSHLVDMRSRTGFSGSPVAVFRIPEADLSDISDKPPKLPLPGQFAPKVKFVALLGVHCGQYYDAVEVRKSPPKRREREGDPIAEGDKLYIQSGMTIVVPVERISELLDLEVFEMARQKRDAARREAWEKKPRPESAVVPPATGENPTHREDFMRLQGAAAQKPKQDG